MVRSSSHTLGSSKLDRRFNSSNRASWQIYVASHSKCASSRASFVALTTKQATQWSNLSAIHCTFSTNNAYYRGLRSLSRAQPAALQ